MIDMDCMDGKRAARRRARRKERRANRRERRVEKRSNRRERRMERRANRRERRVEKRSNRRERRMERRASRKGISSSQATALTNVQATAMTTAHDPYATIENQSQPASAPADTGGIGMLPILLGLGVAAYAVMQ